MWKFDNIVKFMVNEKINIPTKGGYKTSEKLLKVRLCVFISAFVHLVFIATKLLTIDFTKAEDPALWPYANVRWKLITCWFNLASLAYLPVCIYCDWREIRGEAQWDHVKNLNQIRFLVFTGFIFPTTAFADILFWRLWNKDHLLLAPSGVDKLVPFWTQHCMHTVSLVFTLLDLVLVPRKRPASMVPGLSIMMTVITVYCGVCAESIIVQGEYLYPVIKTMSNFKLGLLVLYIIVEHLFYFTGQFVLYDFLWGQSKSKSERLQFSSS
ncbi:androgen-dependent TFPI-regulating protein-like [Ostrinia furnacalis]|uniref:androgen-dependent TFPI-regulating protein-like n=1 Tax=Ostrinia furnacalis TaxID=93504 RepID=UPI00103905C2|nr:androgen-dependent TFPI-regulating protein-like [Ostrinia furnacalis]